MKITSIPHALLLILAIAGISTAESVPVQTQTAQTSPAAPSVSDQEARGIVVARINSRPVSLYTVRELMKRISGHEGEGASRETNRSASIQAALDRAVFEELVFQEAAVEGRIPTREEMDSQIKSLKTKMGEEAFQNSLQQRGLTELEWRAALERSQAIDRTLRKRISDVSVTEEQLQAEYEKQKAMFLRREKITVVDVVFFLKQKDPASMEIARSVLSKIRDGQDHDARHLVPDGSFMVHEMEVKKEKQPELYLEAKKLQTGQLSDVIEAPDALHILQLKEFVSEKQFSLDEVRPLLKNKLQGDAQRKEIQNIEAELKKKARIEITDMAQWKDKV